MKYDICFCRICSRVCSAQVCLFVFLGMEMKEMCMHDLWKNVNLVKDADVIGLVRKYYVFYLTV